MSSTDKDFSFEPETLAFDEQGKLVVKERNDYVSLGGLGHKTIYYTPKSNKFWIAPGKELSEERFKSHYASLLYWDFDQWETTKAGDKVNKFPCTPANIQAKREELLLSESKKGQSFSYESILARTSPRGLRNPEHIASKLPQDNSEDAMLRRINRTTV